MKKTFALTMIGLIATYGSACYIGFLTDWRVGAMLVVFAIGHNIDKHI